MSTTAILHEAVAWCSRQAQKHPQLLQRSMRELGLDADLLRTERLTLEALDAAVLSENVPNAKRAARAWCQSWQAIFAALTAKEQP